MFALIDYRVLGESFKQIDVWFNKCKKKQTNGWNKQLSVRLLSLSGGVSVSGLCRFMKWPRSCIFFFSSISLSRSPLEQLEAEKEEREVKLKKMEQEMEQVFEMKVKEKKKKLKDSEAEVSGGSRTNTWSGAASIYTYGFLVRFWSIVCAWTQYHLVSRLINSLPRKTNRCGNNSINRTRSWRRKGNSLRGRGHSTKKIRKAMTRKALNGQTHPASPSSRCLK